MNILPRPIYLDYMATTPMDSGVRDKMLNYLTIDGHFGNPDSLTHSYGKAALIAVNHASEQIANLVNCEPEAIVWTSGATESINLAIKGAAHFYHRQGGHLITLATEHKAVLNSFAQLAREGFEITYLSPEPTGLVDLEKLKLTVRKDTLLVSILHANNEIGVIQDIAAISEITRKQGILLHVDAAQSAGKIPIDLQNLRVDLMSFSSHKVYGPKGIGALYIRQRPKLHLVPLMQGGQSAFSLRAGTLPVHQIVGMGEAFAIAQDSMKTENIRLTSLQQRLLTGLQKLGGIYVNGDLKQRLPGNLNVSFAGIDAQTLIESCPNLALSAGSACTSGSLEPSHTLKALGLVDTLVRSAIRFGLGRFTTETEIEYTIAYLAEKISLLRNR